MCEFFFSGNSGKLLEPEVENGNQEAAGKPA